MDTRLDVIGLGLAIVDVVLRVERMPDWEDPRGLLDFTLADGGPAGTVVLDAAASSHKVLEPARALVAETDVLICGSGFAPMLTGENNPLRASRAALDLGPRVVVQTEGAKGSYTVAHEAEREAAFHTPAFDVSQRRGARRLWPARNREP